MEHRDKSCVLSCEFIVSVSVYVEVHVCLCVYAIGAGRGHFWCPRLALLNSGPGPGGGKGREGWILDPFLGFPVPFRKGRPLAPQAGSALLVPMWVSTEPVLCDLGPHPHKGWLPWDPKPSSRPGNRTQGGANQEWS